MIDDGTQRVWTARARARVATLLVDTCARARTLRIDSALRSTRGRLAYEALDARTGRTLAAHLAHRVRAARARLARVDRSFHFNFLYYKASSKWIAGISSGTATDGIVIYNLTLGINSACSGAWIDTFLV